MILQVEKPKSFFEWGLSFRVNSFKKKDTSKNKTSLGMSVEELKKFVDK